MRMKPRTVRFYLQQGAMPRPPFRGSATRYEPVHLLWLLAIWRLRASERLSIAAVRKRLEALAPPELEAFAVQGMPAGPLADALGIVQEQAPAAEAQLGLGGSGSLSQVPRWGRIELALGLELHVRDDASPGVLDLASRVREFVRRAKRPRFRAAQRSTSGAQYRREEMSEAEARKS